MAQSPTATIRRPPTWLCATVVSCLFLWSACTPRSPLSPEIQRLQTELQKMEKQRTELEEKVKKPPVGMPSSQLAEELELLRSRMERIREKLRASNAPAQ